MTLKSLATLDPEEYFRQASLPGCLINVHIPKTAGTSLRREMGRIKSIIPIDIDYDGTVEEETDHYRKYRTSLRRRKLEVVASKECFVTGHHRLRDVTAEYADIASSYALMTFLRDPVRRFASDYFYSISPKHPGRQGFLATYPTLDAYIEDEGQHNKMSYYLRLHDGENMSSVVERVVGTFGFVGCVELYDLCFETLFRLIGSPRGASAHDNRSPNTGDMMAALAEKADSIRAVNRDDMVLYEAVKAIWEAKAGPLRDWLDGATMHERDAARSATFR